MSSFKNNGKKCTKDMTEKSVKRSEVKKGKLPYNKTLYRKDLKYVSNKSSFVTTRKPVSYKAVQ